MTARTQTVLTCDRETRPRFDGITTVCGEPFETGTTDVLALRMQARRHGWTATGIKDFCPAHAQARRPGVD